MWVGAASVCLLAAACGRVRFDPLGDAGGSGFVPSCQPAAAALYRSTLDDLAATQQPAVGSPTATVVTSTKFLPGICGNGLQLDTPGEVIEIDQIDGSFTHFDFADGALEWWYRPLYAIADGMEHRLFGCTNPEQGGIQIVKQDAQGDDELAVRVVSTVGDPFVTSIAAVDVPFAATRWVHVSVSWDFGVAAQTPHVRVLFDGIEPRYAQRGLGPLTIPAANDAQSCFVGGFDVDDPGSALGVFDELVVSAEPRQ